MENYVKVIEVKVGYYSYLIIKGCTKYHVMYCSGYKRMMKFSECSELYKAYDMIRLHARGEHGVAFTVAELYKLHSTRGKSNVLGEYLN